MNAADEVLYVRDGNNALIAVQIPLALWEKFQPVIRNLMPEPHAGEKQRHNMDDFAEFMSAWDFPYQYSPAVECPGCHAATKDWLRDENEAFWLKSANLGGITVFGCRKCGGTIRKKHFKDHVAVEFTPPAR